MLISFVPGLIIDLDVRVRPIAHRADGSPEVGQLETQDDVGIGNQRRALPL